MHSPTERALRQNFEVLPLTRTRTASSSLLTLILAGRQSLPTILGGSFLMLAALRWARVPLAGVLTLRLNSVTARRIFTRRTYLRGPQ